MTGVVRDVGQGEPALDALQRSEQKYKSFFDNNLAAMFQFTTQGVILDCNDAFVRVFSYGSRSEAKQKSITEFFAEPYSYDAFVQYLRDLGMLTDFELHLRRSDGTLVLALTNLILLVDGDLEIVQGTLIDITERKRAEDQVAASLREKEILLKEIHHRVKNNLQIISSLLSLQADYIDDARALEMFRESQERINSIALLYDSLYRSEDLNSIDMAGYIRGLVVNLSNTWGQGSSASINLNLQLSPVMLELSAAMPCALIITELISNSMKYAFPDGRAGEIYICMASDQHGRVSLQIGDTGVGLPPGIVPGESDSLGLVLVNTLVKQLRGTMAASGDPGTRFQIEFTPHPKGAE